MHPFLDDQFLTDARDGRTIALRDVRLAVEAVDRLSGDSLTSRQAIAVHAQNRVVILEGSVDSEVCKIRAGQIAGDGRDAVDVCNCLTIFPAPRARQAGIAPWSSAGRQSRCS